MTRPADPAACSAAVEALDRMRAARARPGDYELVLVMLVETHSESAPDPEAHIRAITGPFYIAPPESAPDPGLEWGWEDPKSACGVLFRCRLPIIHDPANFHAAPSDDLDRPV